MNYVLGLILTNKAPSCFVVFSLIVCAGFHRSDAGNCIFLLKDGNMPCVGSVTWLNHTAVNNTKTCCEDMGGLYFFNEHPSNNECVVCQEWKNEHVWLQPFPRRGCTAFQSMWLSLPDPNRRIQCIGRSYRIRHTHNSSLSIPLTGSIYCFRHRYRNFDSNLTGCPSSSLDTEFAKNVEECCSKRGGSAYSLSLCSWYSTKATLNLCVPCSNNLPTADVTWSEWSACSLHKSCTRERSMQIPYLQKMPNYWCLETLTMEENTTCEMLPEVKAGSWISATLIISGILLLVIIVGPLAGFFFFRNRLQKRGPVPLPAIETTVEPKTDYETDDGYLVPSHCLPQDHSSNVQNSPTSLELYEDHTYERISYDVVGDEGNVIYENFFVH